MEEHNEIRSMVRGMALLQAGRIVISSDRRCFVNTDLPDVEDKYHAIIDAIVNLERHLELLAPVEVTDTHLPAKGS